MNISSYAAVARAPFLILSVTLVAVGAAAGAVDGAFNLTHTLLALVGLVMGIMRRIRSPRIRTVTTGPDWVLFGMLLFQVFTGIYVAIFVGWGSSWFAAAAPPYLRSLLVFSPNINYLAEMPWMVRLHIINAFLLIAFFPFTRLVHILVVPNMYLWRKPQVVRWNVPRTYRDVD